MAASEVRAPALAILINGDFVGGAESAHVANVSYLGADRFSARFSLSGSGAAVWGQPSLAADIRIGLDGAWSSLVQGDVDRVTIDPIRGEVQIDGRDYASRLMAARTQEIFENRTASEIATLLAGRHGLTAQVAPTTTLVGRYYQNSHARTTLDQHARATTEWDLLVWLAGIEGYELWVSGSVLNFAPSAPLAGLTVTPDDCLSMQLDRALDLAGGIEVLVRSWNSQAQTAIEQRALSPGAVDGQATRYVIVRPNLSAAEASMLAQRRLAQMLAHLRTVLVEMPGDLATVPRSTLLLADTGTDFDGTYAVAEVARRISFEHGFTQTITARLPAWTVS